MLDGIPLGSAGRIMRHGYGQGEGVGQLPLNFCFPGVTAATVTAAGIGKDEQLARTAITGRAFLVPPMSDGMGGKGGGVMGSADHQSAAILHDIVNAIGDSDADGIGTEVVIIDGAWGQFPTLPGIFEIADELTFFGIHADDRQMTTLKAIAQLGQIFELEISLGTMTGRNLLLIDPLGIADVMQQTGDSIGRYRNTETGQLLGDGGGSAPRPA